MKARSKSEQKTKWWSGLFGTAPFYGTLRAIRRLLVLVVGVTVILVGVALIFLPGPAFIVIPAGLALLATEFLWARSLLRQSSERLKELAGKAGSEGSHPTKSDSSG